MMAFPRPGAPTRDDLAREVSFLPAPLLKGGKKFIKDLLGHAEGMEKAGHSPRDIYNETSKYVADPANETGIFREPSNQWMFELNDQPADLTRYGREEVAPPLDPKSGGWSSEEMLGRFLNHPGLFDREPRLFFTPTRIEQPPSDPNLKTPGKGRGYYQPYLFGQQNEQIYARGGTNVDPSDKTNPNSLLGVLLHEPHHALQRLYDLPRGGMPGAEVDAGWESLIKPRAGAMEDIIKKAAMDWASRPEFGGDPRAGVADFLNTFPKQGNLMTWANVVKDYDPQMRYESLAGEALPWQAMQRMDMDMAERLANPVFEAPNMTPFPLQMVNKRTGFEAPHRDALARVLRADQGSP